MDGREEERKGRRKGRGMDRWKEERWKEERMTERSKGWMKGRKEE